MAERTPPETLQLATFPRRRIRIAIAVEFFVLIVAAAELGPRTERWRTGRLRLGDGVAGCLMGRPGVRIRTETESVVVSAEKSYRVVGAIERRLKNVAGEPAANAEQTGL